MKNLLLTTLFYLFTCLISKTYAQNFDQVYETSFPFKHVNRGVSIDRNFVYGANEKNIVMLNGNDGKILWEYDILKSIGKKMDYRYYEKELNLIFLYSKQSKKEPSLKVCIDGATGKELWRTTEYGSEHDFEFGIDYCMYPDENTFAVTANDVRMEIDVMTGKIKSKESAPSTPKKKKPTLELNNLFGTNNKFASSARDEATNSSLKLSYSGATNFKKIKLSATDLTTKTEKWSTEFEGKVIAPICKEYLDCIYDEDMIGLRVQGNYALVTYEGITCIDIRTGKLLWEKKMDNVDASVGLRAKQVLGISAVPLVTKDAVYIVDLSRGENNLKKIDLATGNVIWKSDKIDSDSRVPQLELSGNILLARFGGLLEVQLYIPGSSGNPDTYKRKMDWADNGGVRGYDVSTGKVIWDTKSIISNDKFKRTTPLQINGSDVYFSSENVFYKIDISSGKPSFTIDISNFKVGKMAGFVNYKNKLIISSDEGVAAIDPKNGDKIFAINTGNNFGNKFISNSNVLIWTGSAEDDWEDFALVNIESGKLLGKIKDTRFPFFDESGSSFIKFDGNDVIRYKEASK